MFGNNHPIVHPEKVLEPREVRIIEVIAAPIRFLIFIALVVVATNSMPFANDGSRLNLLSGTLEMMENGAKATIPFRSGNTESYTEHEPNIVFPEEDRNSLTGIVIDTAKILMVDDGTAGILILIVIAMVWSLVLGIYALPYTKVEKDMKTAAFNTKNTSSDLWKEVSSKSGPALLFGLIVSIILTFILLGKLRFEDGLPGGFIFLGLNFHPYMLVGLAFFMSWSVKELFKTRGYVRHLLTRRCRDCNTMDQIQLIDKKYVRTESTTTTKYKEYSNGHKENISSSTVKVDIYDFTYECQNCGSKFVVQGPDRDASLATAVGGLVDNMF